MDFEFNRYVFQIGSQRYPMMVMLASVFTRFNTFPAQTLSPPPRQGNDPLDMYHSCFRHFSGPGMTTSIPLGIAARACRDFRRVAHPDECLNMTDENIPRVLEFYKAGGHPLPYGLRQVLCIREGHIPR